MASPEQADAHGRPVALLRPLSVRKLVQLLRPLTTRERATILAQAVYEGTMTRVGADQVLVALALDGKCRLSDPRSHALKEPLIVAI